MQKEKKYVLDNFRVVFFIFESIAFAGQNTQHFSQDEFKLVKRIQKFLFPKTYYFNCGSFLVQDPQWFKNLILFKNLPKLSNAICEWPIPLANLL